MLGCGSRNVGGRGKDVHCACADKALAQVAGAPGVRGHGDGVAGKGVGLDHVAGDGTEHGADLGG
jgi:hypothetical protein